ncbi:TetR-like C-terminal domain-containing protein [Streptomyces sp. NPDC003247]|uniref:TetR-like C-terminal domain-containing protein n=1 Tax=Streptomyces sp. NPDC003247 TaxID=3364677 RepID=UPI0036ABEBF8
MDVADSAPRDDPARHPGAKPLRRRGERMRAAVLGTVVRLLTEEGYDGTTVAAVAAGAGVHQSSVYRNWGTRENLIQEAVTAYTDEALPLPDTGSVDDDLRLLLRRAREFLSTPEGQALLRLSLLPGGAQGAEGRDAYWTNRLDRAETVVRRGVERGELRPGIDPRLVIELLLSPLQTKVLVLGEPLTEGLADRLVDIVLAGVRRPVD